MVFPVLVDCGVEDMYCDVVVILALVVMFLGSVELICSVGGILSVCIMGLVTDGLCLSFLNKSRELVHSVICDVVGISGWFFQSVVLSVSLSLSS